MILFYDKKTGEIVGTIFGRIHGEDHLKMWVGDPEKIGRHVIQWRPVKWYDAEGNEVEENAKDEAGKLLARAADFEPNRRQKAIYIELDQNTEKIKEYKINVANRRLVKKSIPELEAQRPVDFGGK